jgi:hypothetical protein
VIQYPDVVYPAVAVEVVRERGRDDLAIDSVDQNMERGMVSAGEEVRRQRLVCEILRPRRRSEVGCRAGNRKAVDVVTERRFASEPLS